jgi:hypothetical protein
MLSKEEALADPMPGDEFVKGYTTAANITVVHAKVVVRINGENVIYDHIKNVENGPRTTRRESMVLPTFRRWAATAEYLGNAKGDVG